MGVEMEMNTEHGGERGMLQTDTLAWQSTIQLKSHTDSNKALPFQQGK